MTNTPKSNDRTISLWSYSKPQLHGGAHTVEACQELQLGDAKIDPVVQKLYVDAPRFLLDPKDIHSFYPVEGSTGRYNDEIPFVVLTKRTLPWERSIGPKPEDPPLPWMALLVFTEEEVSETYTATIRSYLEPENLSPDTFIPLKGALSADDKTFLDMEQQCQYIEVPMDVIQGLVPAIDELPFLAQVRQVEMTCKADMDMHEQGVFSIVMSNRLPLAGRRHKAHLISVEGCQNLLNSSAPEDKRTVRLISLASWTFKCAEGTGKFRGAVERLVQQDGNALRMALPTHADMEENVRSRLEDGFVPVPYHFDDGGHNLAWYRGPAIPAPLRREATPPIEEPCLSASAAMRFDPETGLFDQTYAVAWQLGRSLALADPNFGPRLMGLRRKAHHIWNTFCDRLFFHASGEQIITPDQLLDRAKKLAREEPDMDQVNAFLDQTLTQLADHIEDAAEKLNAAISETQPLDSLLQLAAADKVPETEKEGSSSGIFGLVNSIIGHVMIQLKDQDIGRQLIHRMDMIARLYKVAMYKMIDRVADTLLKPNLQQELEAVYHWMDQLTLNDLPFHHVVAHPQLLPPESIRFFYQDETWWYALFDGAASLGIHSSMDEAFYKVMRRRFFQHWNDTHFKDSRHQWGLYLRSDIVRAWSGVEFHAYEKDHRIDPLLTQKIDDDVLLFLFARAPDRLELHEPMEGLRYTLPRMKDSEPVPFRAGPQNVLDVTALAQKKSVSDSAQWASMLIKAPDKLVLEIPS